MSTPKAVAPCGRPRAGSRRVADRSPRGRPVDTVPQGGSAHPSTASRMLSELILVSPLTARQRLLYRLGGPLLGFLGLLLGEVHLLWAEEHLHQVIRLHPVLQGQTAACSGRPLDRALTCSQVLLLGGNRFFLHGL